MNLKKFIVFFLLGIFCIVVGLYIIGRLYYTNERIIEVSWNIDLPEGLEEEYY